MAKKLASKIALARYEMFNEAADHIESGGDNITTDPDELEAMPYVIAKIRQHALYWLDKHHVMKRQEERNAQ